MHPLAVIGWTVYYDDGTPYTDTPWEELPSDGVVFVVLRYQNGTRRICRGSDYYWRAEGEYDYIYAHDNMRPDPARYKGLVTLRGIWCDDIVMHEVESEVMGTPPLEDCGCGS